jgi:4-hydroxybenzoate polyprenyltransferase
MGTIVAIVVSMRPKQWIKNLIVLAPAIFALPHFLPQVRPMVLVALAAMFLFSLASSGVYLLNDILDREKDRHHPEKQHRPIAAGVLPVPTAIAAMIVLFALALGGAWALHPQRPLVLLIISGYIAINLLYSYVLKNMVIVDAFSIAFGFILRMLAGAEALRRVEPRVEISTWIILCTMLGSFFIAFCKRRQELSLEDSAVNHRASLEHYSVSFLDQMISISCAATVMAYALWTMWPETVTKYQTRGLFWTVPFVCYGIFRYLYLVHQKSEGGSPTKVFLSDRPLQINIALWFIAVVAILYFHI